MSGPAGALTAKNRSFCGSGCKDSIIRKMGVPLPPDTVDLDGKHIGGRRAMLMNHKVIRERAGKILREKILLERTKAVHITVQHTHQTCARTHTWFTTLTHTCALTHAQKLQEKEEQRLATIKVLMKKTKKQSTKKYKSLTMHARRRIQAACSLPLHDGERELGPICSVCTSRYSVITHLHSHIATNVHPPLACYV